MNTNQKINKAMNIRSEKQLENVFIPFNKLHEAANEFYDEIEKLKKSIEHALIMFTWCLILMAILFLSLREQAKPRQQEEHRRSEMYKTITDENGK